MIFPLAALLLTSAAVAEEPDEPRGPDLGLDDDAPDPPRPPSPTATMSFRREHEEPNPHRDMRRRMRAADPGRGEHACRRCGERTDAKYCSCGARVRPKRRV